jgi:hypothetical protein
MARWTTKDFETAKEFLSAWRSCPERVVVRGLMNGRFSPQSLQTVLDEFPQVYVGNPLAGWNVLFVCKWSSRQGRHVVVEVIASLTRSIRKTA